MQRLVQFVNDNIILIASLLLIIGFFLCKNKIEFMTDESNDSDATKIKPKNYLALTNLVEEGTNFYLKCKIKEKNENNDIVEVPYYLGTTFATSCQGINQDKDCSNYVGILQSEKNDSGVFKLMDHYGDDYKEDAPEHEKSYLLFKTQKKKKYLFSQKLKTDFNNNQICFDPLAGFGDSIIKFVPIDSEKNMYSIQVVSKMYKRNDKNEIILDENNQFKVTGETNNSLGKCPDAKACSQIGDKKFQRLCLYNSSIKYPKGKSPLLVFEIVTGPKETEDAKMTRLKKEAKKKEKAKEKDRQKKLDEEKNEIISDPIAVNDEEEPTDNAKESPLVEPFTILTATGKPIFL